MNRLCLIAILMAASVVGCATNSSPPSNPIASSPTVTNVAGIWLLVVNTSQGSFDATMTITQNGAAIKGSASGDAGESVVEGSVGVNQINFSTTGTNAAKIRFDFIGVVEPGLMHGTAKFAQFGDGTWKANWVKNQ